MSYRQLPILLGFFIFLGLFTQDRLFGMKKLQEQRDELSALVEALENGEVVYFVEEYYSSRQALVTKKQKFVLADEAFKNMSLLGGNDVRRECARRCKRRHLMEIQTELAEEEKRFDYLNDLLFEVERKALSAKKLLTVDSGSNDEEICSVFGEEVVQLKTLCQRLQEKKEKELRELLRDVLCYNLNHFLKEVFTPKEVWKFAKEKNLALHGITLCMKKKDGTALCRFALVCPQRPEYYLSGFVFCYNGGCRLTPVYREDSLGSTYVYGNGSIPTAPLVCQDLDIDDVVIRWDWPGKFSRKVCFAPVVTVLFFESDKTSLDGCIRQAEDLGEGAFCE